VALGDKWAGIDYEVWESGCPVFPGALAAFECRIRNTYDGGDHVIFVGEVQRMRRDDGGRPLIFLRGDYGSYAPLTEEE
jgi:flavin reductase (DIM6/NTAB) family NADH-FMN oxidoreductase RutF